MHTKPKIKYNLSSGTPVYQCKCGHCFTRMDLLSNKPQKGTRNYCPKCKDKVDFN